MKDLIRPVYNAGGYVFATKAADIARSAGYERPARLASNENPYPPPPGVLEPAGAALQNANRYPDECSLNLRSALKEKFGDFSYVSGVGMDGVIETVIRTTIGKGDKVVVSTPTFSFYRLAAQAYGGEVIDVPRNDVFSVDTGRLSDEAADSGAKLIFLCSPNNPTGNVIPICDVEKILKSIDGMLFLDNAYVDFCDEDYIPLMNKYDNLIIGRTMSKYYALAGMRVGFGIVPGWFEEYYERAQTPFVLNTVSMAAAAAALRNDLYTARYLSTVREWRERFINESPYPTSGGGANFVMFDVSPYKGDEVVEMLARKGVIIRSCASFPGLGDHYIRVSIGEPWENEIFLKELNSL
ncbi:histidinol-phosphate transaminase [Methanolacinia paynteri]|uniref:histidinol-phosphate transaminase n=1 Tax=Methanolacinia paynteri TaxID=230356 RepID=UPI00064F07E2|nr:histidinol-phosphate transaminase [Methanolacinia paynteri]